MLTLAKNKIAGLSEFLVSKGIKASIGEKTRLVTHLDISKQAVDLVVSSFKQFFK